MTATRATPMTLRLAAPILLFLQISPAHAADDPETACREEIAHQPKLAVESCERAYAAAQARGDADAPEWLARRSDAELGAGDFVAAAGTLDRVAALFRQAPNADGEFRLARRRGILQYRQGAVAEALALFREALAIASARGDTRGEGQSWNDIGTALRRIGDYRQALEAYLASLERKRQAGDTQLGALLNNLGDLYRELGDVESARRRYGEALTEHELAGRPIDAAHTRESLGLLAAEHDQRAEATRLYAEALAGYERAGAAGDQLRLCALLARASLDAGERGEAKQWIDRGIALAQKLAVPSSPEFVVQRARWLRADGKPDAARTLVRETLARVPTDSADRIDLLRELAEAGQAAGDANGALADWRAWYEADTRRRDAEHDQRLEQLRVRFDVAEKERRIEALAAENRLRDLELERRAAMQRFTVAAALFAIVLVIALVHRWRQRERLDRAVREARLEAETAHYRREAEALGMDRERLQALLDGAARGVVAIDAAGKITALNAPAAQWLGVPSDQAAGIDVRTHLAPADIARFDAALADMDERDTAVRLDLADAHDATVAATIAPLGVGHGLAMLSFEPAGAPEPVADAAPDDAPLALDADSEEEREAYRRALVELMLGTVAAWERSTGKTRIELAEKSRIWRITIDEGRLRVRALERYLSLAKLPRRPRWREVLRTVYFVLTECPLAPDERERLKRQLEAVQDVVRRRSLL